MAFSDDVDWGNEAYSNKNSPTFLLVVASVKFSENSHSNTVSVVSSLRSALAKYIYYEVVFPLFLVLSSLPAKLQVELSISLSSIMSENPASPASAGNQRTSFSSLPYELRHMIYHAAISTHHEPRIHTILPSNEDSTIFKSNQPTPALLHLCHESRALYLSLTTKIFAYGTYIDFSVDTLYLADCPNPTATSDGFEAIKQLGRNAALAPLVKRLAVRDSFWLRPTTISRTIAIDAWNVVLKYGTMSSLEEMSIVFGDERSAKEKWGGVQWKAVGRFYGVSEESETMERIVRGRERRIDDFFRAFLAYFPSGRRWTRPVIRYVAVERKGEGSAA